MKIAHRVLVLTIVAALLVVGCGGDDDASSADTKSSTAASTTAGSGTGTAGATPSITAKPAADSGKAGDAFCAKGAKIGDQIEKATSQLGTSPGDMKKSFEQLNSVFAELAKSAPNDIRADFAVLSAGYTTFATILAKYNYDFTKVFTDPEATKAMEVFNDSKFEQASANIEAWATKNCPAGTYN